MWLINLLFPAFSHGRMEEVSWIWSKASPCPCPVNLIPSTFLCCNHLVLSYASSIFSIYWTISISTQTLEPLLTPPFDITQPPLVRSYISSPIYIKLHLLTFTSLPQFILTRLLFPTFPYICWCQSHQRSPCPQVQWSLHPQ